MSLVRFIVDEASWSLGEIETSGFRRSLDRLGDRLEVARQRAEQAGILRDFYEWPCLRDLPIFQLLFEENEILERDQRTRLFQLLDTCVSLDLPPDAALEASVGKETFVAPSIGWAHARVRQRCATAVLSLDWSGRRGPLTVEVEGDSRPLHFVTSEAEHLAFFRDAFEVERCDEKAYQALLGSAFPDLLWVDDIWRETRRFTSPFEELRELLTKHFAVLNDKAAELFRTIPEPAEIIARLAAAGIDATPEAGRTKKSSSAEKQRTRRFQGQDRVFWWHSKLFWNTGRIHFLYDTDLDRIVVGLFADHCDTD